MRKNSHFSGQPLYGQVIKLLDKSKILAYSRDNGGERYTKRFNCWIHLVDLRPYTVIYMPLTDILFPRTAAVARPRNG